MTLPALVLAAGQGTRIAPLTGGRPKPLLELAGRSILGWNLSWLAAAGVETVWINVHTGGDEVRAVVGDGSDWGVAVRYSPEPELLGTAGAWGRLRDEWTSTSLVVYGDNLMRFSLDDFVATHRGAGVAATAALFDPTRHANTGMAGGRALVRDGRVTAFVEGGAGGEGFVNAGAYLLEPSVAQRVPAGFSDFGTDVLPELVADGELASHLLEEGAFCLGVDTPAALRVAEELLRTGKVTLA